MSQPFELPLFFEIKQSRTLLFFIGVMHVLALWSCLILPVELYITMALISAVLCSLIIQLEHYQRGYYPFYLKHTDEKGWQLARQLSDFNDIRIVSSSVLTAWVIILHIQQAGKPQSLLVVNDTLSVDAYRELSVALRITAMQRNSRDDKANY